MLQDPSLRLCAWQKHISVLIYAFLPWLEVVKKTLNHFKW